MQWEALVTDGHVRAKRLRTIGPVILVVGSIFLILSLLVTQYAVYVLGQSAIGAGPSYSISQDSAFGLSSARRKAPQTEIPKHVERYRDEISKIFSRMQGFREGAVDVENLAPAEELPEVLSIIKDNVSDIEALTQSLPIKKSEPSSIWSPNWPDNQLLWHRDGEAIVVAAIVNAGNEHYPRPMRWMMVFRKFEGQWVGVQIRYNGFYNIREDAFKSPHDIFLTLSKLGLVDAARDNQGGVQ